MTPGTCMSPGCRRPAAGSVTKTNRNGHKCRILKCAICLAGIHRGSFKSAATRRKEAA